MSDQVEVQRRRKGSGPQGRADQPSRRETGGGTPGGGGGFPPLGGGGGGFNPLSGGSGGKMGGAGMIIGLILLVVYYLISGQLPNLGDVPSESENQEPDVEVPSGSQGDNTLPESNFTPPAPAVGPGQTWLVMMYQDADDQILERDIYIDLNEAERVGSSERVRIVAQLDRFRGAYQADGNWTSARRYFITRDNDLEKVNSPVLEDLGEVDMSDKQTLIDFVLWAMETYPSDNYALILSDHGMGWPGGWSDPAPGRPDSNNSPLASRLGANLYLMELDDALGQIRQQTGLDKFELIGMDACLMAQLEVLTALQPHGRYAVLSEETEPALGWAYSSFLGSLTTNPNMGGDELSQLIVKSYIDDDQRVVDPQARADFLRNGSPLGGLYGFGTTSAEQVAQQLGQNVTLSAIDLDALPALHQTVNDLALALQNEDQSLVASARQYATSYTNIFGKDAGPAYIDLGNFVQIIGSKTSAAATQKSVKQVLAALQQAVIAEKHGPSKRGSTGIAIYFPNSALYRSPLAGPPSYTVIAKRFATESLWDDFLAFHYLDRSFDSRASTPFVPPAGYSVRAPGQGAISVSDITASATSVAPGDSVRLSVDISGQNIGYVYLFVGFLDSASQSIFVADTDYLESPDTREIDGAFYPEWPASGSFTMNFTWEPIVFALSDGDVTTTALFKPQAYGASAADATYVVNGIYTFADSGERRYAQLEFRDGQMRQVFGFTSESDTGAPREIIPQSGDTFTVLEKWLDLGSGGQAAQPTTQEGRTLTFGSNMFEWQELFAAAGDYVVGFIVEDLDGNAYPVYTQITVN